MAQLKWQLAVATVLCRLVILPLCGMCLIGVPYKLGWFSGLPPMAILVMLIVHSTPTAIIVHGIAVMHRNREDDLAALLFYEYFASILTLPIMISLYLSIITPAT